MIGEVFVKLAGEEVVHILVDEVVNGFAAVVDDACRVIIGGRASAGQLLYESVAKLAFVVVVFEVLGDSAGVEVREALQVVGELANDEVGIDANNFDLACFLGRDFVKLDIEACVYDIIGDIKGERDYVSEVFECHIIFLSTDL